MKNASLAGPASHDLQIRESDPRIRLAVPTIKTLPALLLKRLPTCVCSTNVIILAFGVMFKHANTAKSIYVCPHPSILTTARPYNAVGTKNKYQIVSKVSTHTPDPRVEAAVQAKCFRGSRRSDPHETRVSQIYRKVAGRVRSGQDVVKSHGSGRVGSGQEIFEYLRPGRVESKFSNLTGRVGSGQVAFKI